MRRAHATHTALPRGTLPPQRTQGRCTAPAPRGTREAPGRASSTDFLWRPGASAGRAFVASDRARARSRPCGLQSSLTTFGLPQRQRHVQHQPTGGHVLHAQACMASPRLCRREVRKGAHPEQIGGASSRSVNFLAAALKQAVAPACWGRCAPASRAPSPGPSLCSGCGLGCAPCLSRRLATRRNPARKPPALLSAKAPPIRPGGAVEGQNRSSGESGRRAAATQAAQEPIAMIWRL